MKGAEPDLSAATFQIHDETHTMGNALRWMLMKKCATRFIVIIHVAFRADSYFPLVQTWNFADIGESSVMRTLFIGPTPLMA
jgi:hypothetical protein